MQPPIDFMRITPLYIYVHLMDGTVDEYSIVVYPDLGMIHMHGARGEYPISQSNLYWCLDEEERIEMVANRVAVFYRNLGIMLDPSGQVGARSPHPLFNKIEYGE